MTLRQRLFVTSLGAGVPLAVGLFVAADWVRLRQMDDSLRQYVARETATADRARCEANPGAFGPGGPPWPPPGADRRGGPPPDRDGPPPDRGGSPPGRGGRPRGPANGSSRPFTLFVYDDQFNSANPSTPAFPADLRATLAAAASATARYDSPEGRGVVLAAWTPWGEGACAILLARLPPRPGEVREQQIALGLVVVTVLAAVWLAAGPVIGRMRRLTEGVRQSAASHYAAPVAVEGRDELAKLAVAFNDAGATVRQHLQEIERRSDTLRQFVANTTHDVAVPLTVLQGHLAELDRTVAAEPAARAHVRAAVQEAHYMSSLVRNLSAATRLEGGVAPLDQRPIDLGELVERVVARHRPVARAMEVEIDHAVPEAPVVASGDLLEQAVGNLVDNAIRHNRAGGHVAVVLDRATGGGFSIRVVDDGPGVAEADLPRLTERWFRSDDARTRRPDGHGLGLAIANEAAARLGFTLVFRRPSDGGLEAEIAGRVP